MSRILFIDPSSTVTGYAVMGAAEQPIDAGLITPAHADDPAHERAWSMACEVWSVATEYLVGGIVIEIPSGHVHGRHRHRSHGAGLSVYGMAAGIIYAYCRMQEATLGESADSGYVQAVEESDWTNSTPKEKRAKALAMRMPGLDLSTDTGRDMADAIELGLWWFEQAALLEKV